MPIRSCSNGFKKPQDWFAVICSVAAIALLLSSCSQKPEPYSIVEIKGNGELINYSKGFMTVSFKSDSINPNFILAEKGDLLTFGENSFFIFSGKEGRSIEVNESKSPGFINGSQRILMFNEKNEMIPSLKMSDSASFPAIDFISFNTDISQDNLPFLMRLAEVRPGVGLTLENDIDISLLLKIFDPGIILGATLSDANCSLLSKEPDLESLLININDTLEVSQLPAMPELEQLIISGSGNIKLTDEKFLANNSQIERLSIIDIDEFDCAFLKPLTNLKELLIFNCDNVLNTDLIKNQKKLELLVPQWDEYNYDITAGDLPALRWISFTSKVPQNIFDNFVKSNPGIEVVEIVKNYNISSLESLLTLKKLYGLTVIDTLTDINTVKSLKSLKYLSLPDNVMSDSLKKNMLRQSLPGTVLSANEGVCLGSGWLLLLIPFVFLFRLFPLKKLN